MTRQIDTAWIVGQNSHPCTTAQKKIYVWTTVRSVCQRDVG